MLDSSKYQRGKAGKDDRKYQSDRVSVLGKEIRDRIIEKVTFE